MLKRLTILIICLLLTGCGGTGFNKNTTLMPDEISISIDSNPNKNWEIDEVTGGIKWKLK
jgi:hypothetical protein